MGYTHYWKQPRNLKKAEMAELCLITRLIIDEAEGKCTNTAGGHYASDPVKIAGGHGDGRPIIGPDYINFNGEGDLSHETFHVNAKRGPSYDGEPRTEWGGDFCKTARKPYDVVVTAILSVLASEYNFNVGTDGEREDWDEGVKLATKALGREVPNPIPEADPLDDFNYVGSRHHY